MAGRQIGLIRVVHLDKVLDHVFMLAEVCLGLEMAEGGFGHLLRVEGSLDEVGARFVGVFGQCLGAALGEVVVCALVAD